MSIYDIKVIKEEINDDEIKDYEEVYTLKRLENDNTPVKTNFYVPLRCYLIDELAKEVVFFWDRAYHDNFVVGMHPKIKSNICINKEKVEEIFHSYKDAYKKADDYNFELYNEFLPKGQISLEDYNKYSQMLPYLEKEILNTYKIADYLNFYNENNTKQQVRVRKQLSLFD